MSNAGNSSTEPINRFWDVWSWNQHWRQNLERKATHKALGIPDDDMNITTSTGMGWKELAIMSALIAAAAWAGMCFTNQPAPQPQPVQQPAPVQHPLPVQPSPTDAAYDVLFYDAAGNELQLDRWPGSVPKN